jgi:hypothetical protein
MQVPVRVGDRRVDLIGEAFDIAIRVRALIDSNGSRSCPAGRCPAAVFISSIRPGADGCPACGPWSISSPRDCGLCERVQALARSLRAI